MKPFAPILFALATLSAFGQTQNVAPTSQPPKKQEIEIAAPRPVLTTNQVSTNAIPQKPKEPTVTYSGLVQDVRKSTNRWKIFSLRRPANPKEDNANLVRDLRTEASPAVKLISVDF